MDVKITFSFLQRNRNSAFVIIIKRTSNREMTMLYWKLSANKQNPLNDREDNEVSLVLYCYRFGKYRLFGNCPPGVFRGRQNK